MWLLPIISIISTLFIAANSEGLAGNVKEFNDFLGIYYGITPEELNKILPIMGQSLDYLEPLTNKKLKEHYLNPNKRNREIQAIAKNFYQFVANQLYIIYLNVAKKIVKDGQLNAEELYKEYQHKIIQRFSDKNEKAENLERFFANHNKEGGEPEKVQFLMLLLSFATRVAYTMGSEALRRYGIHEPLVKMDMFVSAYEKMERAFPVKNAEDNYNYRLFQGINAQVQFQTIRDLQAKVDHEQTAPQNLQKSKDDKKFEKNIKKFNDFLGTYYGIKPEDVNMLLPIVLFAKALERSDNTNTELITIFFQLMANQLYIIQANMNIVEAVNGDWPIEEIYANYQRIITSCFKNDAKKTEKMKKFFQNYDKTEQGKAQFMMLLLSFAKQAAFTMGDEALVKYNVPITFTTGHVAVVNALPPINKDSFESAYRKIKSDFQMNLEDNSKYRLFHGTDAQGNFNFQKAASPTLPIHKKIYNKTIGQIKEKTRLK